MRKQKQNRYKIIKKEIINGDLKLSVTFAKTIYKAVNMVCNLMLESPNDSSYIIYDTITKDMVEFQG
jgi:hypothetical protein